MPRHQATTSLYYYIPPLLKILSPNIVHPITVVIAIAVKAIIVTVIKAEIVIAVIVIMVIK